MADPVQTQQSNQEPPVIDLGVNVDFTETNLFTEFHKGTAATKTGDVVIATGDNGDGKPEGDGKGDDGKPKEKIEFDTSGVLELAKKTALGQVDDSDEGAAAGTGDDGNAGDNKPKPNTNNTAVVPEGALKVMYDHFVETLGYSAFTDEKPFDGKPETFNRWMADNQEDQAYGIAETMISETFLNNPKPQNAAVAKDLFNFLKNGGLVADFVQTRKYDDITPEFISSVRTDDDKLVRAKTVMQNYYKSQNWDDQTIEKTISQLETGGALLSLAETTLPQFIKDRDSRKAIVDQNNELENKKNATSIKEYNTKLVDIIDTSKAVGVFELKSAKEREDLKNYMFLPTVAGADGKKIPQYLADRQKAGNDPAFTVFHALTMKNKGIDLSNITQKISTEQASSLQKKLESALSSGIIERTASSSGDANSNQRTKVTDFLNFDDLQTVITN